MCDACESGLQYALAYLQSPTAQANMKSYALTACRMYGKKTQFIYNTMSQKQKYVLAR